MTFEDLKLYTNKPGTYRITAIFDGNDEYSAKETTFILIIDEDPEVEPTIIPLPTNGEPQVATLTFDDPIVEFEQDIETNEYKIQFPNNPNRLPLSWSCNTNNVIFDIENGKINIPNVGEYIITVSFSGNDEYQATSASYRIRVTDENGSIVVDKPRYGLYFDVGNLINYVVSDNIYFFQSPKTQRTNDNVVPQDIMNLCYYTIGNNLTHITDSYFEVNELGTYTIYLHFIGNDNWRPETISYEFNLKEVPKPDLLDPNLSFAQSTIQFDQSFIDNKYILQTLLYDYSVSPIEWSVTSYNSEYIVLQPKSKICIVNRPGTYTITARFNGNSIYSASEASYDLIVSSTNQGDAQIYYERISDTYTIYDPIGDGYTIAMPKLINPFQLPYTITVSTNDIMVEQTGGEYDRITFFTKVRNAEVVARFAGNDTFGPMTATYTVTLIALANRETPILSFPNLDPENVDYSGLVLDEPDSNENGVYTLQRIYSPNVPKSSLTWTVAPEFEDVGCRLETIDEDNHLLIVDGYDHFIITVSFAGDDDYYPTSVSYKLAPQRLQAELYVLEPTLYLYNFEDGFVYNEDAQPCYLRYNGVELGEVNVRYILNMIETHIAPNGEVTFNEVEARGIIYDEENNKFVITREGTYKIYAVYDGDNKYNSTQAVYEYVVSSQANPNIIKRDIEMSFNEKYDYTEYDELFIYGLQQPILYVEDLDPDYPPLEELPLRYEVFQYVQISDASLPESTSYTCIVDYNVGKLFTDGIGLYRIKASFDGNEYYNPTEAYYTLYIWKSDVAKVDIDLLFGSEEIETYNFVSSDNTYRYPRAAWKLHSEPEGNYYQNWKYEGLDINYSCSDPDATIVFDNDRYDGTITLPNGEGYYTMTATFSGNVLFNPASASYIVKVGNPQITPIDCGISFSEITYNVPENWPDNLYTIQALNNPNNIPAEELHWSVTEADGTPAFTQAIEIRDGQIYVYDIRYDVVVTVTYNGNADQFPHNTNIVYAPKTISYTMHVVPETIVKRDVTISFTEPTINWLYDDYYHVEISPQTPTLSEDMPIVWSINNGGQMRGEQITENRPTGNVVIETRNPRIYLDSVGTYTVTASFAGDRYRNPATASYTIELAYNYASVYFENEIVTVELDTESSHYYYPIQAVTKPNDIEVVYYLYLGGNNKIQIDQAQGCDLIASAGDWEIRAYYTEYGVEKYVSYTLRVVDDISQQEETGTVSFDQSEIVLPYSPTNRYNIQKPTCTGVYTLIKTVIGGQGASTQELSGYSTMDIELDDGLTYTVRLTYKVGGDEDVHTISYHLVILPEYDGITFNPRLTYDKLIWNMSKTISNRYTIRAFITAENVCGYGTNKNQIGEYDRYSLTKQFDPITLNNNNPDLDLPIYNFDSSFSLIGSGDYNSKIYAWQRFTKATITLTISKNNVVVDTFNFVVEKTPDIANYGYDTIIFRPTRYHYSNPIPKLTIDNSYHSSQIIWNHSSQQGSNINTPLYMSPVDEIMIDTWNPELSAPDTFDANVTIYKPNNEQYLVNRYNSFTNNLTVNFVGEQQP